MGSCWGNKVKISLFGESHGKGIGVVIDGLPSGISIDMEEVRNLMYRRAPGRMPWSTKRSEKDVFTILSGFYQNKTTGTPLCATIGNTDTKSEDYQNLMITPRPGHADLTGMVRYLSANDPRGGGHFSARVMAPFTFAGGVCLQILQQKGITVRAHIYQIKDIADEAYTMMELPQSVADKEFPVLNDSQGQKMIDSIEEARMSQDSLGGIVECIAVGMPAGLGNPIFDNIESRLASIAFGIPAVKGVEFGRGFGVALQRGSTNNDSPQFVEENIRLKTNHGGGIEGGISNGMPIVMRCAFKPTSSISLPQATINLQTRSNDILTLKGRHDPCVVPRAVPIVESAMAIALLDILQEG